MRLNSIKRQHSRLASCPKLFPDIPTTCKSIIINDARDVFVAVAVAVAVAVDAADDAAAFQRKLCKF